MTDITEQLRTLEKRVAFLERLENAMAQNHGYIGGAWQKDPIRLGYSDVVRRAWSDTNLSAGANSEDDTAVPAGEIWVITNIAAAYVGTMTNVTLKFIVYSSATEYRLCEFTGLTSGVWASWQGEIVLEPGELLRVGVANATSGDDLYAAAVGWRVDIDL